MGLRQTYLYWQGQAYTPVQFSVKSIYNHIRHPIMLGTLICLWATPNMTVGHLLFASGFSLYIFIGIYFEERDMHNTHGEFYGQYCQKTSMIMPTFIRKTN
jgi:protein-S-isoprenylcysteine O-methyltransferase Ste14